jgi:hypothetical protein
LDKPLGDLQGVIRAKKPRRLPVVLSRPAKKTDQAAVLISLHWIKMHQELSAYDSQPLAMGKQKLLGKSSRSEVDAFLRTVASTPVVKSSL